MGAVALILEDGEMRVGMGGVLSVDGMVRGILGEVMSRRKGARRAA